jgi:hypothetical protein
MCKPKIKKIGWFLSIFPIAGITLAPFGIYVLEKYLKDLKIINHESIHWKQQMEMLIIFFYLWYVIEWIIRIFVNGNNAYKSLSFEREAYQNDDNLKYLETRKHFSWWKYINGKTHN